MIGIDWIYRSCYKKDWRSAPDNYNDLGVDDGLLILADIRDEFGIPVVSDFYDLVWGLATGKVWDMVQVPPTSASRPRFC
jgi:2-dehydro-3-deoxyphosphooctonate aldolase (KDO 8-P synthase)